MTRNEFIKKINTNAESRLLQVADETIGDNWE